MHLFRQRNASLTTLISFGVFYAFIVVITLFLSRELVRQSPFLTFRFNWLLLSLGIFFFVVLLILLCIGIIRLIKERRKKQHSSTFKRRLAMFFLIVLLLIAIPQGLVSVNFLSTAMQLLFDSRAGLALQEGLDITLGYYDSQVDRLLTLANSGILYMPRNPADISILWETILFRMPRAVTLQALNSDGEEVFHRGDVLFLETPSMRIINTVIDTSVQRYTIAGETVLRLTTVLPDGNVVLLTTLLPDGFNETARTLTRSIDMFSRLQQMQPTFVYIVGLIYILFFAPILILAILISFFLANRLMRPIESLEDAMQRIKQGDYSVRILVRPTEDLGVLVFSFNQMANELSKAQEDIARAKKVQAWQEIAQRLAHEVKNPLTPIKLAAENLQRRYEKQEVDFPAVLNRTVSTIVREVDSLAKLLNEFRSLSRMPEPYFEQVNLYDLLVDVESVYQGNQKVHIDVSKVQKQAFVSADRGMLRQVFVNLFSNAVSAGKERVNITVQSRKIVRNDMHYQRIQITDDGHGIPKEMQKSVFEPYVTTKAHGIGLGLAIVDRIIFDNNGHISLESTVDVGTTFTIDLPIQQAKT